MGLDELGLSALEVVRAATAGPESPFAKLLIRAAGRSAVALADGRNGVGRYQEFTTLVEALRATIGGRRTAARLTSRSCRRCVGTGGPR